MFSYKKFEQLCKEKKVTPHQVSKATGVATATLSSWKKRENGEGGYCPKLDKLMLIADYFGVDPGYFMKPKVKK